MNHHPLTAASMADEAYVRQSLRQARKRNDHVMGFWYVKDSHWRNGSFCTMFVTVKPHRTTVDKAMLELKNAFDIGHSTILLIPETWLEEEETVM